MDWGGGWLCYYLGFGPELALMSGGRKWPAVCNTPSKPLQSPVESWPDERTGSGTLVGAAPASGQKARGLLPRVLWAFVHCSSTAWEALRAPWRRGVLMRCLAEGAQTKGSRCSKTGTANFLIQEMCGSLDLLRNPPEEHSQVGSVLGGSAAAAPSVLLTAGLRFWCSHPLCWWLCYLLDATRDSCAPGHNHGHGLLV